MNKPTLGAGSLALVGLLFIGIMLLANTLLRGAQVDLTQDRLYTLSQGTRNILRDLEEPVNLYLFFSDSAATPMPDLKTYGTRVRELLESMAARSNGEVWKAPATCDRWCHAWWNRARGRSARACWP